MTSKSRNLAFLRQYLVAQVVAPWIAKIAEPDVRQVLHELGGIAGDWRTDRNECFYYVEQV